MMITVETSKFIKNSDLSKFPLINNYKEIRSWVPLNGTLLALYFLNYFFANSINANERFLYSN